MKKNSTQPVTMTTTAIRHEHVARGPKPEILAALRQFARAYRPFGSMPGIVLN